MISISQQSSTTKQVLNPNHVGIGFVDCSCMSLFGTAIAGFELAYLS